MTEWQMAGNVSMDTIPAPVPDVKVETIAGELLLYHPAQTKAVYLNPPAAIIWSLCDGRRDVRTIVQLIAESYPDSTASLADEVLAALTELYENQLLVAA
jgi:hypothetical protein